VKSDEEVAGAIDGGWFARGGALKGGAERAGRLQRASRNDQRQSGFFREAPCKTTVKHAIPAQNEDSQSLRLIQ
jgi:hypothetical protein